MLRIITTVILLAALGWLDMFLTSLGTVGAGQAASAQFVNSDTAYVASRLSMKFFADLHLPWWLAALVVVLIWWRPWTRWLDKNSGRAAVDRTKRKRGGAALALIIGAALAACGTQSARAYYADTDYAESYFILPNQSAFYIPDVGANKDSQAEFGSEQYFKENKIAAKRFDMPHVKLPASGWFSNKVVNAGRLILVDRTPVTREWVDSDGRGTASKKEGFPCQTKEGLNQIAGVAIGLSVAEQNAPKFLYRFGVKNPTGDPTKPEIIFTSVFYGKSLAEAADDVIRKKIQSLVCDEFYRRTFDNSNSEGIDMMKSIAAAAKAYCESVGVTLEFIGWADSFEPDKEIQKAINDRYIADKIGPVMSILTQNADNAVKEGLGKGLATKGLPANLVAIPESLMGLQNMFGGTTGAAKK